VYVVTIQQWGEDNTPTDEIEKQVSQYLTASSLPTKGTPYVVASDSIPTLQEKFIKQLTNFPH